MNLSTHGSRAQGHSMETSSGAHDPLDLSPLTWSIVWTLCNEMVITNRVTWNSVNHPIELSIRESVGTFWTCGWACRGTSSFQTPETGDGCLKWGILVRLCDQLVESLLSLSSVKIGLNHKNWCQKTVIKIHRGNQKVFQGFLNACGKVSLIWTCGKDQIL